VTAALFFPTSRADGLNRLSQFTPQAGRDYAAGRNTDFGPGGFTAVSKLSPYLRYRVLTEQEVVASVLALHDFATAEKYVQEVLWRTYWKGWLEMRPAVWSRFQTERDQKRESFIDTRALAAAQNGTTGIDGFDDWARELVATGYLHNHARMWFASIWIFTLRLPWALGADFFLRHLIDADAASNTLSWRWVAGLQTPGKTYLATTENIKRFTNGRFAPTALAREAVALSEPPMDAARALPEVQSYRADHPALLLVTHDDMQPESIFANATNIKAVTIVHDARLLWGDAAAQFVQTAAQDTATRATTHFGCDANLAETLDVQTLIAAATAANVSHIVTPYAPVGPVGDALRHIAPALASAGITLSYQQRSWDRYFWPHATKGFFPFRTQIPLILSRLGFA
jgi:deoxyribodipyrimidine photo-lyase